MGRRLLETNQSMLNFETSLLVILAGFVIVFMIARYRGSSVLESLQLAFWLWGVGVWGFGVTANIFWSPI